MIADERSRPAGCVTDLKIDAWFAGELGDDARAAVDAHVSRCARCRTRRAMLAAQRDAFLARAPHASVRERRPTRHASVAWPRLALGAATIGIAAALALALRPSTPLPPSVRTKGGGGLGFFVQSTGMTTRGVPGQAVHPGNLIRFVVNTERAAYLAIYGRDADGAVSVYYPDAALAQRVQQGHETLLDTMVKLDHVLGPETVIALFCDAAFHVAGPRGVLTTKGTLVHSPGCRIETLMWRKERAR
jgi:hypothetical protein